MGMVILAHCEWEKMQNIVDFNLILSSKLED